jgi:hypothetical protein
VLGDECPQPREAENLTFGVVGLDETITVEEGAVAFLEHYLLLLVVHARHETQRHPPCLLPTGRFRRPLGVAQLIFLDP